MKYKLLKDLPDVKAGNIATLISKTNNYGYLIGKIELLPSLVENNPDWFAPLVYTTDAGDELYHGDTCYALLLKDYPNSCYKKDQIVSTIYPITSFNVEEEYWKIFSTNEKAEQYLKSLEPKFKVGDIVVIIEDGFGTSVDDIGLIFKIVSTTLNKATISKTYNIELDRKKGGNSDEFTCDGALRKATNDEIIKYYEQKGWVKGAMFKEKCNKKIHILGKIKYSSSSGIQCAETNGYPHTFDDCELVDFAIYLKTTDGVVLIEGDDYYTIDYENNKVIPSTVDYQTMQSDTKETFLYRQNALNILNWYNINKKPNYPKSWEELNRKKLEGYTIAFALNRLDNKDLFTTDKQRDSVLTFTQLTKLHKAMIDEYNRVNNCDWKHDWKNQDLKVYTVIRVYDYLKTIEEKTNIFRSLTFPTKELADFSLENHKELWKQYYKL